MSCSSLPGRDRAVLGARAELVDRRDVRVGDERRRIFRALVEHGAAFGDLHAQLVLCGLGRREVLLRLADTLLRLLVVVDRTVVFLAQRRNFVAVLVDLVLQLLGLRLLVVERRTARASGRGLRTSMSRTPPRTGSATNCASRTPPRSANRKRVRPSRLLRGDERARR